MLSAYQDNDNIKFLIELLEMKDFKSCSEILELIKEQDPAIFESVKAGLSDSFPEI